MCSYNLWPGPEASSHCGQHARSLLLSPPSTGPTQEHGEIKRQTISFFFFKKRTRTLSLSFSLCGLTSKEVCLVAVRAAVVTTNPKPPHLQSLRRHKRRPGPAESVRFCPCGRWWRLSPPETALHSFVLSNTPSSGASVPPCPWTLEMHLEDRTTENRRRVKTPTIKTKWT